MTFTTSYSLVGIVHRLSRLLDWLTVGPVRRSLRSRTSGVAWPSVPGAYMVGDQNGSVAVCTLTSSKLVTQLAKLPGVAIAGRVYTANLGIEKVIANVTGNPMIRFLVLCGKESPFFQVGQALKSLSLNGITPENHIAGAQGHLPQLNHLQTDRIEQFRHQVEVVDYTGETDAIKLAALIQELIGRKPGRYSETVPLLARADNVEAEGEFKVLQPGGHREPLAYDPNGFFVITLDRQAGRITVRHYLRDNTTCPQYERTQCRSHPAGIAP